MNNDNKTIHDFDFNLICEYFTGLERQGPGSHEVTLKALSFIDGLNENSKIADLGCGTGTQTIYLAQHTKGHITAMDLFPDFINILNKNKKEKNLDNRIDTIVGSMIDPLPFAENELDLIWSEGAIYNIGYEKGLNEWRKYLKEGGYIAVSEATWFTPTRPYEIEKFWMDSYDQIDVISTKVRQMENAGYKATAHFILPVNCWEDNFYRYAPEANKKFLQKNGDNKLAVELVQNQEYEMGLYRKYKELYGYVFYIGQKI